MSESPVPQTFSSLVDHVASLSVRMDAFEETLQNRSDVLNTVATMAGEALERTKGLQVPEILRRLRNLERLTTGLESAAVHSPVTLESATDDRLLSAVNELTTVMREAVAAQKQGAELVQRGLDALTQPVPVRAAPVTCPLTMSVNGNGPYHCTLDAAHEGDHIDEDGDPWHITGL